jgi:hypothetical protein
MVRESIVKHGILQPIVFDEHGAVLDGHNRLKVAREPDRPITDYPRSVMVAGRGREARVRDRGEHDAG